MIKAACGSCKREKAWISRDGYRLPISFNCQCGSFNKLRHPDEWPAVPKFLYIGADKVERLKVYATPPEQPNAAWALPYSIRSFVAQGSHQYGCCAFSCTKRGNVMGEPVFRDRCFIWESEDARQAIETDCHLVTGWSTGTMTCPLWEKIAELCQTDYERRFLHHYLRYAKDRQFPMLIPQPRIGVAERRRPDFVVFIPLQHWNYHWLAVELDGAHSEEQGPRDAARNIELAAHGYDVFSVRPAERGYLEEVRRLVERIEERMGLADSDPWEVSVAARVTKTEVLDDLPF